MRGIKKMKSCIKSIYNTIWVLLFVIISCNLNDSNNDKHIKNSIGIDLIKIESGSFLMGSESGEFDEKPIHNVNILKSFYISSTPITNAQYELFDPDHKKYRGEKGLSTADNDAVVFVTWEDAVNFTKWLSKKENKVYRLPTEAEWEYVCRAGTNTTYYTGDSLPESFFLNQNNEWYQQPVSLEVAKTEANLWGIYNMHGLVEEWCLDWYGMYINEEQNDPIGYNDGYYKVTRGGSHNTDISFLRSANRLGMLPDDKNCLVGFRIVQAEYPKTKLLIDERQPSWAQDVSHENYDWNQHKTNNKPYFGEILYFQNVPENSNGPLYSKHNHCPDITPLPNGDMFVTWYSTNEEQGRELSIVAARLKRGDDAWSAPEIFFKVPDRNMHATSVFWDRSGNQIYHFQGVAVSSGWGDLALLMRVSNNNGVTWSKPHWINKKHGLRNMPIAGVKKTKSGFIILPCDAATAGEGGSAIHISNDNGKTWTDPGETTEKPVYKEDCKGGSIAGIHAGIVELNNGNLLALGRGNNINGCMPKSISEDMGKTWKYHATTLPAIDGGQRLALLRLQEGPLMLVSFTSDDGLIFKNTIMYKGYGLYVALSYDEGDSWPVKKLLTPGIAEFDGGAWTQFFKTDKTHAEPKGYMAATQAPDGVIHVISSKLHYRFNFAWIVESSDE
jgi:formylglycine-generating enzyme required for sulfatase activity